MRPGDLFGRWFKRKAHVPPAAPLSGRTLVLGHFSTVGDLEVLRVVERWLGEAERPYDVAPYFFPDVAEALARPVDWRSIDPAAYSELVFVCGPMLARDRLPELFERFAHCRTFGVNLTMLESPGGSVPFERLWRRDAGLDGAPDLSFLYREELLPTVGVCLVAPQAEYRGRGRYAEIDAEIAAFLARHEVCVLRIDTRVPHRDNATGMGTVDALTTLIRKCDVLVSTRLHGLVLALKHGVPVVAIDPVAGGQKVLAQARALEWPHACEAGALTAAWLDATFAACCTAEARGLARRCAMTAAARLDATRREFVDALRTPAVADEAPLPAAAPRSRRTG